MSSLYNVSVLVCICVTMTIQDSQKV